MRVLRVVFTGVVAASFVGAIGAGPAQAGGGSSFEFDGDVVHADYLVVGQVVTGRMQASFDDRELEDAQFYAYLEPVSRAGGSWKVPPRLSPAALRLGPIKLGPFEEESWGGYFARATIAFTVPDVAPDQYVIEYCNSPCTKVFGTSSNVETWVEIVASPVEARLRDRIDRLDSELRTAMWRDDSWERNRITRLTKMVLGPGGVVSDSEMLRDQASSTQRRIAQLEERVERLSTRLEDSGFPWVAYALGALVLSALAVIVLRTNRKPTEVKVSLVEQSDPTLREWELVSADDRDRELWGAR